MRTLEEDGGKVEDQRYRPITGCRQRRERKVEQRGEETTMSRKL
jgi:hypothetical protein